MVKLIGICGYARSGKDTAATALTGKGWTRKAFADALKQDAATALRSSIIAGHHNPPKDEFMPWFTDPALKETFRPFMVEYGRAMRNIYPTYWIERLALEIEPEKCYVITDVRYANEADWVRSRGGKVVEIVRPGVGPANNEEKNSMEAFKPDAHVYNNGTVEELHRKMEEIA
jgi:hypothetical protein